ncbi:MAG TPA: ribosome-associated translation inhibitor RaiA [Rhizomicrobium sp.]|nr:ribosome-associated translation inhibitor RaiA [Rhizomicrobium sp.]
MKVKVSGKNLDIGEALPEDVRKRVAVVIEKHFKGGAEATVVIAHEGPGFRADCTAHLDAGVILNAEGVDGSVHRAFDAALAHLEKQIRRYKRRLKNHHEKARMPKRLGT